MTNQNAILDPKETATASRNRPNGGSQTRRQPFASPQEQAAGNQAPSVGLTAGRGVVSCRLRTDDRGA